MTTEANEDGGLQPGQIIRPIMTIKTASRLVEELYGLKVLKIKELISYDDKNYKVEVSSEEICNPNIKETWPHGYIFKVLNSMDSKKNHIDAQHKALRKIFPAGITCPQPVLDEQGRDRSLQKIYHEYEEGDGPESGPTDNSNIDQSFGMHIVRLLTCIPGQIIATVPYTAELLLQAGQIVGKMDTVLQDFSHPALTSYQTIWNIIQTPRVREFLYAVEEQSKKDLVNSVLEAFDNIVLPLLNEFKKGAIHGDFNEQNILVDKSGTNEDGTERYSISGVIDFGDMTDSYYIFEAAIAIMYMSLDSSIIDPLDVGGYVLAGYTPQMPLNDSEWKVLKECVCARFCTSLVMGVYSNKMDPSNTYVLTTAKKGWDLLRRIWETPKKDLYLRWQGVIKELDPSIPVPDIEDII